MSSWWCLVQSHTMKLNVWWTDWRGETTRPTLWCTIDTLSWIVETRSSDDFRVRQTKWTSLITTITICINISSECSVSIIENGNMLPLGAESMWWVLPHDTLEFSSEATIHSIRVVTCINCLAVVLVEVVEFNTIDIHWSVFPWGFKTDFSTFVQGWMSGRVTDWNTIGHTVTQITE